MGDGMSNDHQPGSIPVPGFQDMLDQNTVQTARGKVTDALGWAARRDQKLVDLGAGIDPDYVSTLEHFEGMTHQALYDAVHGPGGLDPAGLQTLRRVWYECYSELVNLATFNLMGLNRIFGNGLWQGAAADAAEAAMTKFAAAANQVGQVFGSVSDRFDAAAWAAEAVRAAVQPPPAIVQVQADPDNTEQSILPGLVNGEYERQVNNAREQARLASVAALNTIYKPSFPPAGAGVPTYADVPQIGDGPAHVPGGPSDIPSNTGPRGAESGAGPAPGQPLTVEQPGPGASAGAGSPLDGGGTGPAAEQADPNGGSSNTTAASAAPTTTLPGPQTSATPNSATPGASGTQPPASGPFGNVPSTGSRPTLPPDGRSGGLGTSRPNPGSGLPGGGGVSTGGARSTPSMLGRQPTSPLGPMTPGSGARRNQEGDEEHYGPEYLRRVHDDWTEGITAPIGVVGAEEVPLESSSTVEDDFSPYLAYDEPTTRRARFEPAPVDEPPMRREPIAESRPTTESAERLHIQDEPAPDPAPVPISISDETSITDEQLAEMQGAGSSETILTVTGTGPFAGMASTDEDNPNR